MSVVELSNIIQKGEEVKYRITIDKEGFDMYLNNFKVVLYWGNPRLRLSIDKPEMFMDEDGYWYFTFSTEYMDDDIEVNCIMDIPDDNYPDGIRTEVDKRTLCHVTTEPCPCGLPLDIECNDPSVQYTRTNKEITSNYYTLSDTNGLILYSSDGLRLQALKEIEE